MAVDLHLHSTASDGSDEPSQIVALASDAGLKAIALTDHDNLDGIAEASAAAESAGLRFLSGTELSVSWRGTAMHMLVYFLDPGPGALQDELATVRLEREDRNRRLVARLMKLGLELSYEEVVTEAGGSGVGRPHFAAALVRKGYVESLNAAFDVYLAEGQPGYVPRNRLDAAVAIGLARQSGAVPVIAHPHTLNVPPDGYAAAFQELVGLGLGGIESYYGDYTADVRDNLVDLCGDLGIVATGGSDYHGTYKKGLSVGTGPGDLVVPDHVVSDLEEQKDRAV